MVISDSVSLDNLNITDEGRYNREGYPFREWDILRNEAPIFWYDRREDLTPFWAITRHDDIQLISRHPEVFVNSKRLRLHPIAMDRAMAEFRAQAEAEVGKAYAAPLSFIDMDPPDHAKYRALTNRRFTPRAMKALEDHFDGLAAKHVGAFARRLVDEVAEQGTCDFVRDLAVKVPTEAIFDMLGIPEEDRDQLFAWRNEHYEIEPTANSRTLNRRMGEDPGSQYLTGLIARRREEIAAGSESDDLISVLLRSAVDGEPLPERAVLSYINLLIAGGLDTTRHATTGGLVALLQHPDQVQRLVENPDLLRPAVEEILRWTSPVICFTRTAIADFELRGQHISAGQDVAMWYPSANRDEEVFEDPYRFDVAREPNNHLAFGGYGEHFCFGANLARWELYSVFGELLRLLPEMELVGEPLRTAQSLHVGGYRSLPVRYRPVKAIGS